MNDANPLTGLPGNRTIRTVLERAVIDGDICAYVDIVDFKPFNDHYGFALGDAVIRRLGLVLTESLGDHFVGHIGGDDFICAGRGENFITGVEEARQRFRSIVPGFYSARDRTQGGIESFDRRGSYRFFPMLDISVVFTGGDGLHETVEELAAEAGRLKKQLKGEQFPEPVHPVLRASMGGDFDIRDQKALVEACGILREEEAVPLLDEILSGKFNWNLRKSAALALGHIGNQECGEILMRFLSDRNPHVRTRSVQGLVLAMGCAAGPVVHSLITDSSTWVRRAVLRGIGSAGWLEGADTLRARSLCTAPGQQINTCEERRAALEGIAMLGIQDHAEFLHGLCTREDYFPSEAAFAALCAVGTDLAAELVVGRGKYLPPVLNLFGVSMANLSALEKTAEESLGGDDHSASCALRFYEGFPGVLSPGSAAELKNCLGAFYGEKFRRLVVLLEKKGVPVDRSCIARVSNRIEKGQRIGDDAICAFLGWVSRMGGVTPGCLLDSFLRTSRRPVAASAALAAGALARRGLTRIRLR